MIQTILNNEFKKYTGQDLTGYEYTALLDFIEYYGEWDWDTRDLRGAVADFINECYDHDPDAGIYEIKEWWKFPMAVTTVENGVKITRYRGGTTREVA